MRSLLRLLRPHQYIKNGFVLVGFLFAGQWQADLFFAAMLAFFSFCAISSAVYVMNDIVDISADRQHPSKKNRPIASGAINTDTGWIVSFILTVTAVIGGYLVSKHCALFIIVYALVNLGYSLAWKHIAVLDVFIISSGFMLRILAGTHGIGIAPSTWLLLCGLMFTLFLGFAKRRAEMLGTEKYDDTEKALSRRVLGDYTPRMIEQFMSVSAACAIITYSLYTVSAETIDRHGTDALIYTVPFVVYGIYRYVYLLHVKGRGNDIARDLYADVHLLATVLAWFVATIVIIS